MLNLLKNSLVGFLIGLFGLTVLFRGLFGHEIASSLWADGFDSNLIYWIMEWGYYKIYQTGDWVNFWNANQFYPYANSLAYSESLLSLQLIYGPFRLLGFQPLEALYISLAFYTLLACGLTDYALRRIGGFSWYERALIIYIAHFSMSITNFLSHYQFFAFEMAPPIILFYFLFLRDRNNQHLLVLSFLFALAVGFSAYFAPMVGIIFLILLLIFITKNQVVKLVWFISSLFKKENNNLIFISFLVMCVLYLVQLRPYLNLPSVSSLRDWSEAISYSAKVWSLFLQAPVNSTFYSTFKFENGYWEYSYFPGIILLTLSVIGGAISIYKIFSSSLLNQSQLLFNKYIVLLFFSALILSFGPLMHSISLPFILFSKLVPGFENIRAPGRFGMLLGLPMGIFAVYAIRVFHKNLLRINNIAYFSVLILVLISFDSALTSRIFPFSIGHKEFYENIRNEIEPHQPLAVLPLVKQGHLETIMNFMDQLKGSTIHKGWIVSGYGSRSTAELSELVHLDRLFQENKISFEDLLDKIKKLGINNIIIFQGEYPEARRNQLAGFLNLKENKAKAKCFTDGCILKLE